MTVKDNNRGSASAHRIIDALKELADEREHGGRSVPSSSDESTYRRRLTPKESTLALEIALGVAVDQSADRATLCLLILERVAKVLAVMHRDSNKRKVEVSEVLELASQFYRAEERGESVDEPEKRITQPVGARDGSVN